MKNKDLIKEMQEKHKSALKDAAKYMDVILVIQKVCKHDWDYQGHSHNDDLYLCSICGKEEWR